MDPRSRISNHIASLCQCKTWIQCMGGSWYLRGASSGLHSKPKKAEGGFSPSTNSRGLTDRLNDTVGVTACLRLIFSNVIEVRCG